LSAVASHRVSATSMGTAGPLCVLTIALAERDHGARRTRSAGTALPAQGKPGPLVVAWRRLAGDHRTQANAGSCTIARSAGFVPFRRPARRRRSPPLASSEAMKRRSALERAPIQAFACGGVSPARCRLRLPPDAIPATSTSWLLRTNSRDPAARGRVSAKWRKQSRDRPVAERLLSAESGHAAEPEPRHPHVAKAIAHVGVASLTKPIVDTSHAGVADLAYVTSGLKCPGSTQYGLRQSQASSSCLGGLRPQRISGTILGR
jgi:hypothetical protein